MQVQVIVVALDLCKYFLLCTTIRRLYGVLLKEVYTKSDTSCVTCKNILYCLYNFSAIVVVTDGVFLLENAYVTDALLAQCRNSTAVVSFLQVGSGFGRPSVEYVVSVLRLAMFLLGCTDASL